MTTATDEREAHPPRPSRLTLTRVWALVSGLTVLSWAVALDHDGPSGTLAATGVVVLAAVKARLILQHFMEIHAAPRWLGRFTDAWVVLLSATVLAMQLAA